MKVELAFCAFLVLATSVAVSAQPARDDSSIGPRNAVILIIRHAEDADSGKVYLLWALREPMAMQIISRTSPLTEND
jgi:hypothetical protein